MQPELNIYYLDLDALGQVDAEALVADGDHGPLAWSATPLLILAYPNPE